MTKEIDRAGIPIVHICNLTNIAEGIGSNRIFQGKSVLHALGDPSLSPSSEEELRINMVQEAIRMLETQPE